MLVTTELFPPGGVGVDGVGGGIGVVSAATEIGAAIARLLSDRNARNNAIAKYGRAFFIG